MFETHLRTGDLTYANLQLADLRGARITNEELARQAYSFEDAIMPDGQKHEAWIETPEGQN